MIHNWYLKHFIVYTYLYACTEYENRSQIASVAYYSTKFTKSSWLAKPTEKQTLIIGWRN